MSFRDFDSFLAEKLDGPPTFVIGGQKFTCRRALPWKKFSAMILALSSGKVPEDKTSVDQTEDFFRLVLIPEDRQRFIDLLNYEGDDDDPEADEKIASNEAVGDLIDWLMGIYLGKAESKETTSSDKRPTSGRSAKTASLNSPPKELTSL